MQRPDRKYDGLPSKGDEIPRMIRSGLGFHTFEVTDYEEFLEKVVPHFRENRDYIWRGSRDPNWHLISRLTRHLQKRQEGMDYDEWTQEASRLTAQQVCHYLMDIRGVEEMSPAHLALLDCLKEKLAGNERSFSDVLNTITDDQRRLVFELFAQGQHHELATPLLDWTRSPHVALFFAFEQWDSRIDDEGHRVLYALNRKIIEKKMPLGRVVKDNGILFIESMAARNPRLIGQSGLFTFSPSHLSIESWVIDSYGKKPGLPVLLRFLVRNKSRKDCLADLELMNIHSRSLFPDLSGAARSSNYLLERP